MLCDPNISYGESRTPVVFGSVLGRHRHADRFDVGERHRPILRSVHGAKDVILGAGSCTASGHQQTRPDIGGPPPPSRASPARTPGPVDRYRSRIVRGVPIGRHRSGWRPRRLRTRSVPQCRRTLHRGPGSLRGVALRIQYTWV